LQEEADGTLTPENPSILELEARADRMAVGEEAQAVRDFQRRLDYNMRKVRCGRFLSKVPFKYTLSRIQTRLSKLSRLNIALECRECEDGDGERRWYQHELPCAGVALLAGSQSSVNPSRHCCPVLQGAGWGSPDTAVQSVRML